MAAARPAQPSVRISPSDRPRVRAGIDPQAAPPNRPGLRPDCVKKPASAGSRLAGFHKPPASAPACAHWARVPTDLPHPETNRHSHRLGEPDCTVIASPPLLCRTALSLWILCKPRTLSVGFICNNEGMLPAKEVTIFLHQGTTKTSDRNTCITACSHEPRPSHSPCSSLKGPTTAIRWRRSAAMAAAISWAARALGCRSQGQPPR